MLEVWDPGLGRRLAAKVLRPDIAWTSGMLARFRDECRVLASLNHPNILPIHFVGEGEGLTYYIMPFVEGQSLGEYLRSYGALDVDRALAIAVPVLQALGHAHQAGLLHRDIKPDNVLIEATTGRVLLLDFGIAKRLDRASQHTQTGFVVGTPQYMSPEQALGQMSIDARSDIYAFGAMLFQMVTGAPPYDGDSSQEIVGKHIADPVPVPQDRDARVPVWLSDIIVRCLAKRPADRYQSVAALLDAIERGRTSGARATEPARRVADRVSQGALVAEPGDTARVGALDAPAAFPAEAIGRPRRRGVSRVLGVVIAAGVVAALAWWLLGRPATLAIVNRFDTPLEVTAPDGTTRVIPPRQRAEVRTSAPGFARLTWTAAARTGADGRPRGESPSGELSLELPRGTIERTVGLGDARVAMFEPLVTNAGTRPLEVIVNHGLLGGRSCDCTIAPGAVRESAGYYPLYRNTTVRAVDPTGRAATFENLGPEVDRRLWKVGLRFVDTDFR